MPATAHRYLLRRREAALLGADPRGARGRCGARGPSPVAGWVLAAVAAAGCVLAGRLQPQVSPDAPILLDAESGALYVRVAERLHPVLNLTSARLIAGSDAAPRAVPAAAITRTRRGPTLGIPGAPPSLGPVLAGTPAWSICDSPGDPPATVVLAGADQSAGEASDPGRAVPVTSTASGASYLLHRGRRVPVDPALLPAMGAHPVSAALLAAVPDAPPSDSEIPGPIAVLPAAGTTVCVHWHADVPTVTVSIGAGLPAGAVPVPLAQADGPGPAVDAVALPPGHSAYVQAVGLTGRPVGGRYLVSESGVRFPVDADAARSLGLTADPVPVPWPILTGLPVGPQLSRENAGTARDVPPPPAR